MQGHIRTFIDDSGQIEVDDLYLGVDMDGNQYVVPVEAKSVKEPLGVVQVVCLNAYARQVFPGLKLRSVAIKAWRDNSIFFMEFNDSLDSESVAVIEFRRYRLVREGDPSGIVVTEASLG